MRSRDRGRRCAALLAAGLSVLACTGDARAEPPAIETMRADMRAYFAGEKSEAIVFLGFGVASLGIGSYLATRDDLALRGAGYPIVAIGALSMLMSAVYHAGIDGKVESLDAQMGRAPAAYKAEELPRIEAVERRFVLFRYTEIAIIAAGAGLATAGFVKKVDVLKGVGFGLAAEAALFLTLDFFAEARAHRYRDRIKRFEVPVAVAIEPGPKPGFNVSFNRSF